MHQLHLSVPLKTVVMYLACCFSQGILLNSLIPELHCFTERGLFHVICADFTPCALQSLLSPISSSDVALLRRGGHILFHFKPTQTLLK